MEMHMAEIEFSIVPLGKSAGNRPNHAYLSEDRWDDWRKYRTQFYLTICDASGVSHNIGSVKIGQRGLKPHPGTSEPPTGHRKPAVPTRFDQLNDTFFSLGQDDTYYERLGKLGNSVRVHVLKALRDVAYDADIWSQVQEEEVTTESLLRSVSSVSVEGQYRRLAHGRIRLTPYAFAFAPPKRMGDGTPPYELEFDVIPSSKPPTNIHVLIGRNGVGKTRLLVLMAKTLAAPDPTARQSGTFRWRDDLDEQRRFASLVTVSFSAFDDTELPPEGTMQDGGLKYFYIGLRRNPGESETGIRLKTPPMLATEFVKSLAACSVEAKRERWLAALEIMSSDPVFQAADLSRLIDYDFADEGQKEAIRATFGKLSSGHKIVILTLTRLIETVEEKTLVLVDEPEAHLHPPLLSAFVRALSNLLVDRNGVAIVATHSPVVLQEVPRTCAWMLRRFLEEAKADRPSIETFGENVGILSREVFQLELIQSGYHRLLDEVAQSSGSYGEAVQSFGDQLGAEARAVLRAMYLEKQ